MYVTMTDLDKCFGSRRVVDHLNLTLPQGKILCLLGSSGCGKTTTLRMIGGFLSCDHGSIVIDGEDVTAMPAEQRPVATVFQSYALFPNMNVLENVIYGLKFRGISKAEAQKKGAEYLEIVGLSDYAKARIHEISGGQQQRVALARAMIVQPKVLLLDEPLSNLDAKLRVRMREEIRSLQQKLGMTMIFVTHDQEEAMVLGDEIAVMHEGRLVQNGTPWEVYHHPVNAWVMNFLGQSNQLMIPGRGACYVRPEAITICENGELCGMIKKSEYLGFYCQYEIDTEWGMLIVRGSAERLLAPGDSVRLQVREEAMLQVE